MAILKNLVVNGSARIINKLYCGELAVSGASTFGAITASSLSSTGTISATGNISSSGSVTGATGLVSTNGNVTLAGKVAASVSGNYLVLASGFSSGVQLNAKNLTTTGTINTGSIITNSATIGNGVVSGKFIVNGVLESNEHIANIVRNVGGDLKLGPTFEAMSSTTLSVTAVTATTVSFTLYDTNITSATYGSATWYKNSEILFSGIVTGNINTSDNPKIIFSSAPGTVTARMNTTAKTLQIIVDYSDANQYFKVGNNLTYEDVSVMMYRINKDEAGTLYPIGIYLKSYGTNKESFVDVYGGTSQTPNARLGLLNGLSNMVSGNTPSGWGVYTTNGYFEGVLVSTSGIIGGWEISNTRLKKGTLGSNDSIYVLTQDLSNAERVAIGGSGALTSWRMAVGSKFGIDKNGVVYASDGHFTGTVNANNGIIGGWTISSDRLYARTTYPDEDGEGTDAYVMMRTPSSMSGTSTSKFLVVAQNTIWYNRAATVSMRFTYDWTVSSLQPPSRPLTVSVMDHEETVPQTFRYSLWWKEYGASEAHTESSSGTTSLETTIGDSTLPIGTRIQAGITIYIDIAPGLGAQFLYLNILLQYNSSSPTSNTSPVELKAQGCYLWYASDIPTDRITTDTAFVVTNSTNTPRWYVTSDGNMLANHLKIKGIFASSADQVYWYATPVLNPSGGLAVYSVGQTPLTPDAPDNTDGGTVLVLGDPQAYMQMAFLKETDDYDGMGIYTRYIKGATVSDWDRLTRPQRLHNFFSSRQASPDLAEVGGNCVKYFNATSTMTTNKPPIGDSHILHFAWDNNSGWDAQLALKHGGQFTGTTKQYNAAASIAIRGMRSATNNVPTWSDWYTLLDLVYPVGSVYITNTNTNPSNYTLLGGGTWTLISKSFADKDVTDAVTWNSTNIVSGSGQSVFFLRDKSIKFRLRFTNKVALNDNTITLGTVDFSKIGLNGCYWLGFIIAGNDTSNAVVLMDINNAPTATGGTLYPIRSVDVVGVNSQTIAASTSTSPTMSVTGELFFAVGSMQNTFCDKFYWKRTA